MYRTKEIRWFFLDANESILKWFHSHNLFSPIVREDIYLNLKNDTLGIKLRERQIEIKQRIGLRTKGSLKRGAQGNFEQWVKWGFDIEENEKLLKEINQGKYFEWVPIIKERLILQIVRKNGSTKVVAEVPNTPSRCQVEYTKLKLGDNTWYTFGLEWSKEDYFPLQKSIISEILGDTSLSIINSKGYPGFITTHRYLKDRLRTKT